MTDIQKTCTKTGKAFEVREWEKNLIEGMGFPLPSLHPDERLKQRLLFRNERKLYKTKCALSGKDIVSIYDPNSGYTVYSNEAWYSDQWNAKDYGRDYDFDKLFFEQIAELQKEVPRLALLNVNGDNSDYCNMTESNKGCYLVFGGDFNQDSFYSVFSMRCSDVSDVYWVNRCELMYDCVDCNGSYNLKYCQNADNCSDSAFLFECRGCRDCFGCVGLTNKQYHIFNKAYSKEEYERILKDYRLDTWSGVQHMKKEFETFRLQFPHRFAHIVNSEKSEGDHLSGCKNCENAFGIEGPAEDLKDVFLAVGPAKSIVSTSHVGHGVERLYEVLSSSGGNSCAFCISPWGSNNLNYCDFTINSQDCFGCVGLNRAEYCILNKQYSKEDYEALMQRIVEHMKSTGEWGRFFPEESSPFAYNETVAQDLYPLSKQEALEQGHRWKEEERRDIDSGPELADSIHDIDDSILQKTLVCQETGRPYKIIAKELALYKKIGVPVPRYAPETRNTHRIGMRNPVHLWQRNCAKCEAVIQTSYAPERPETVYCEACYLGEVY